MKVILKYLKQLIYYSLGIIIMVLALGSCNNNHFLKEVKTIPAYPSASAIEFINKQFFIIGDDANNLLVLDSNFIILDSVNLYSFTEKRIPKSTKPDLESITTIPGTKLLVLGSGSVMPFRNTGWIIDPLTKQKENIRLDTFYQRLLLNGLSELNIEGVVAIPGSIILSNRGNKSYRKNHLVITKNNFWNKQEATPVTIIPIGINDDSTAFNGVSGLGYSRKTDKLLLTVSTENTRNNVDDGAIGKSYLWIVNSISSKLNWKAINPNKIIDLEKIDPRFKGQKIESVCITHETKNFIYLVLVADNDNGSSTLFRLVIAKD